MSDTGDPADPVQNGSTDVPTEVGDGDRCSLQAGRREPADGPPSDWGPASPLSGIGGGSSGTWERQLQAARGGCRESQAALFAAVREQLVTVANQGIGQRFQSKFDGSDVVQETLIDAACGIGEFRGKTRAELVAWLTSILIHRMANARRRYSGVEKRRLDREVALDCMPAIPADDTSPSVRAMRHESHERLEQALRQLPEPDEQIVRLRNQLDLTFDEIATALGCSRTAASQRWARAVLRLQLEFERDGSP